MTDEDAGEEERQKVMNSVKKEWFSFWQDTGDEGTWNRRRSTITQLLSLYRNRRGRLRGGYAGSI